MRHGRLPLGLKLAGYKRFVRPGILHGNEACCLKERDMAIIRKTERSLKISMCAVQLKDKKRSRDFIFMLDLKETMDQLTMANNARCYGHVLRREDGHVFRKVFDFEVEGKRKKVRPKRTWKKQVE